MVTLALFVSRRIDEITFAMRLADFVDRCVHTACHFPSSCPADQPCPKMIEVTCTCGHIKQQARCGASDSKPEGNNGRQVKCTDACAVAKRNAQLAEALGVEKKEPKIREVEYEQTTLAFYASNLAWCKGIEEQLIEFVKSEKASLHLPVMKRPQRQFVSNSSSHVLLLTSAHSRFCF